MRFWIYLNIFIGAKKYHTYYQWVCFVLFFQGEFYDQSLIIKGNATGQRASQEILFERDKIY